MSRGPCTMQKSNHIYCKPRTRLSLARTSNNASYSIDEGPFDHSQIISASAFGLNPLNISLLWRTRFDPFTIETIKQIEGQQLFEARDAEGERWCDRKVVLVTGVRDVPPDNEGYSKCWANGIYHCLFCDGYEERGQETAGVLALGPIANPLRALHLAQMAWQLSKFITVYTDGNEQLTNEINMPQRHPLASPRGPNSMHDPSPD